MPKKLRNLKPVQQPETDGLQDAAGQLASLNQEIEQASKKLAHIEKRIVEAEEAYSKRAEELRDQIRSAEKQLLQTENYIKEYEKAQETIRKVDEDRDVNLSERERDLHAAQRVLLKDRQEFNDEKTRFKQTQAL